MSVVLYVKVCGALAGVYKAHLLLDIQSYFCKHGLKIQIYTAEERHCKLPDQTDEQYTWK